MDRRDLETRVASHYSQARMTERLLAGLGLQTALPGSVRIDVLFPVDQLHHGGVGLTEKMAECAGIRQNLSVLDAGSGIGGSARFLAARFGCRVTAIDLSADYVTTARDLDELVGLTDRVSHRAGSVTDLPEIGPFDVVWCQNVSMNVADKAAMFAEAFRVLKPGGVYVLSHIAQTGGDIAYPLPWAMDAETSFATSPTEFLRLLREAGFSSVTDHVAGVPSAPPPKTDEQPDESAVMGANMKLRRANLGRAMKDGTMVPMLVTARR